MYYNIVRKLVRNKPSDFKDSLSQLFESISTEKEDLPTDRVSYSSGHEFGLELKQKKKKERKKKQAHLLLDGQRRGGREEQHGQFAEEAAA